MHLPLKFGKNLGSIESHSAGVGTRKRRLGLFAIAICGAAMGTALGQESLGQQAGYPQDATPAYFQVAPPSAGIPTLDFDSHVQISYQQAQVSFSEATNDFRQPQEDEEIIKDLEERLAAVEKDLKKAKDAEQKKKDEDATKPSVKPRGRLHTDANWFHQSAANRAAVGDIQDGTYIRRARLGFDAKAFEVTEYRLDFEMGSGGGRPSIFDAYGKITQLPRVGNLQIGHFREPFSLEAQTSSNWFTFIERSTNNTFDPSRNWGVMIFDHSDDLDTTWAIGAFREGSDNFGDDIGDSGERAVTSRVTYLPYFDEPSEGRYFFEVGASYSYRDPDNRFLTAPGDPEEAIVRYIGAPEDLLNEDGVGRVPVFIQVLVPDATNVQLFGVESSWNIGSLNIQSEYIGSYVNRLAAPSVFFNGAYVQASYFLTGECRQFDRKVGSFGRAQVFENFFRVRTKDCGICTSRGAWEIACRWNYLDLSSEDLQGGYMDTTGLGVNWYLSPYMRLMFDFNYVDLHDVTDGRSDAQAFATRLDVHF